MGRLDAPSIDRATLVATCSDEELARAARFRSPASSATWLMSRWVLRFVLSAATGSPAAALKLVASDSGKPRLAQSGAPEFSLSHSGGFVAVAVAGGDGVGPVGVDLEVDRRFHSAGRLADHLLGPAEARRWTALAPDAREPHLLRQWTRTEALLKATGEGVAGGIRDAEPRLAAEGWRARDLDLAGLGPPALPGVDDGRTAGAVAARGEGWVVQGPHWVAAG
jgi:4'-phosphopantetheinyl transferase